MILLLAIAAVQPDTVNVSADRLMQLCMAFRYNEYLIDADGRWRDQHGDHSAFLPMLAPDGPCQLVGINPDVWLDPKGTDTQFPNTDIEVEKRRIEDRDKPSPQ